MNKFNDNKRLMLSATSCQIILIINGLGTSPTTTATTIRATIITPAACSNDQNDNNYVANVRRWQHWNSFFFLLSYPQNQCASERFLKKHQYEQLDLPNLVRAPPLCLLLVQTKTTLAVVVMDRARVESLHQYFSHIQRSQPAGHDESRQRSKAWPSSRVHSN